MQELQKQRGRGGSLGGALGSLESGRDGDISLWLCFANDHQPIVCQLAGFS